MNKIVWFNVGFQNSQYSIWQTAICSTKFDSIQIETDELDENGEHNIIYVPLKEYTGTIPKEVVDYFKDEEELLSYVKEIVETGEDVFIGNYIRIHVYDIFDMDDKNEYGLGKPLWD